jgi:4-hydroxybenzoyl-CoA reductase subunit beta
MMRLPYFSYHAPTKLEEAVHILAEEGPTAMPMAGGTDLLPNMKRKQQVPETILSLKNLEGAKNISNGSSVKLGAGLSLTEIVENDKVRQNYRGLYEAAVQVATPHLRNMGTIGGNICLDTRCFYYDQNYDWRKAISFCMKKEGEICWVSTGSKKCLATSSTDTAPALISLGAEVILVSKSDGERTVPLAGLYQDDGIDYMLRRHDEILTQVILPEPDGWISNYWKLRRRGSFDFPVLSVATALKMDGDIVADARIVLGAVSSEPVIASKANEALIGNKLTDEVIEEVSALVSKSGRPVKNTDFNPPWRRKTLASYASYSLKELRGDDMTETRQRTAFHQI